MIERNAIIKSATIDMDDHGVLTAWIQLDYGHSGQGFGGYILYSPTTKKDCTGKFLWRVMEVIGVSSWSQLVGKAVRVRHDNSTVKSIAQIIGDEWFTPAEELV